jgi:hypothetical protein
VDTWETQDISGELHHQHYFQNKAQMLFSFLTFILLQVFEEFQSVRGMWYHSRLNTEADMSVQVSYGRSDIRDIANMQNNVINFFANTFA